jgi:hypothetical protein
MMLKVLGEIDFNEIYSGLETYPTLSMSILKNIFKIMK